MRRRTHFRAIGFIVALVAATLAGTAGASGAPGHGDAPRNGDAGSASDYWTAARRDAAIPRDLVVDHRGFAYLELPNGNLRPYGHDTPPQQAPLRAVPAQKPSNPGGGGGGTGGGGGSTDTTPPSISGMDPDGSAPIGDTYTFSAQVSDPDSGVKSVSFEVWNGTQPHQSFNASASGDDTWSVTLAGFSEGTWTWRVNAKNGARKGGLTASSDPVGFEVQIGTGGGGSGGGGSSGNDVANDEWTLEGAVQTAAGRIYFLMPSNPRHTRWTGYVCSGTVVTDSTSGRSVILTAAHCVYDDEYKSFARDVLFIPDQAATSGTGTDLDCDNDPLGCWTPSFGVVDDEWASRTFPDNIPWDYAYYVVDDSGAHSGAGSAGPLDSVAGSLSMQFDAPDEGAFTHALGYSYDQDPKFMYCAEGLGTEGSHNWWLGSCGLSGGSSGGPWVQPMDETTGTGPIISVNSWGRTNSPGMAGPKLSGTSAECLFSQAESAVLSTTVGGITLTC